MTAERAGARARPGRGRRAARPTGDDRELAILATAERLLADRPLSEIAIDDLARGAGISRPTFYFYFPSKETVLLTLLDRVIEEAESASATVLRQRWEDPARCWRDCITAFHETFRAHRAVALACAEARSTSPEVRELWAKVMDGWVRRTATAIDAERERGVAPPGPAAHDLAVALNLMNERVLYATLGGDGPAVAEQDVVDVLLTVWLGGIYRTTDPAHR